MRYISKKGVSRPTILVNLVYRAGGGGCGGGPSTPVPHANVMLVDSGNPGEGFEKIETKDGASIFMAKPIFEAAKQSGNPLMMSAQGIWLMKKLKLEGLDLSPLRKRRGAPIKRLVATRIC